MNYLLYDIIDYAKALPTPVLIDDTEFKDKDSEVLIQYVSFDSWKSAPWHEIWDFNIVVRNRDFTAFTASKETVKTLLDGLVGKETEKYQYISVRYMDYPEGPGDEYFSKILGVEFEVNNLEKR